DRTAALVWLAVKDDGARLGNRNGRGSDHGAGAVQLSDAQACAWGIDALFDIRTQCGQPAGIQAVRVDHAVGILELRSYEFRNLRGVDDVHAGLVID